MVLRARRRDRPARRRHRLRRGGSAARRRRRALARASRPRPVVRAAALADRGRGRRAHGRAAPDRPRGRPAVPAGSRRRGAVADRRQHRHERGRAARVQVRRHRCVGDGPRGGGRAGRADPPRRPAAKGRGRLRPQEPPGRLGGDARRDHGGMASPDAGAGSGLAGDRVLRRRSRRLRGDRTCRRQRRPRGDARVPRLRDDALRRRDVPRRSSRRRLWSHRRGGRLARRGGTHPQRPARAVRGGRTRALRAGDIRGDRRALDAGARG